MGMIAALTSSEFAGVPTTLMHYDDATTSAKKAFSLEGEWSDPLRERSIEWRSSREGSGQRLLARGSLGRDMIRGVQEDELL